MAKRKAGGTGASHYPQSKNYGKKTQASRSLSTANPLQAGVPVQEDRLKGANQKLPLGERLRLWRKTESVKIAAIPGLGAKAAYIWEYYKLWLVGIIALVAFIGFVITRLFFTVTDYWIYGMFANTMVSTAEVQDDFTEYAGYDTGEGLVFFNGAAFFDASKSGGTNNSYFQSFVAVTEAGDLDFVCMGEESLKAIGASGRLLDLSGEEAGRFAPYADRFVYAVPIDEEYSAQPVPVGIDLSDTKLVTTYGLYEGDCVLGVGAYSGRLDAVSLFLQWCLDKGET